MTYLDALLCKYIYISIDHLIKCRHNNTTIILLMPHANSLLLGEQLWTNNSPSIGQEVLPNNNATLLDQYSNRLPNKQLKIQPQW